MRYVLAWRTPTMPASSFWYYDVQRGRTTLDGTRYSRKEMLADVAHFVKNGSLVYFRVVKEN